MIFCVKTFSAEKVLIALPQIDRWRGYLRPRHDLGVSGSEWQSGAGCDVTMTFDRNVAQGPGMQLVGEPRDP
jgi:hypothetical protein